jgi:Dual specificity phosphatase, catalytic domain
MHWQRAQTRVSWSVSDDFSYIRYSESIDFIQVHCLMGISRSATVVCGYFVATMKMTPQEALTAVKAKRGIVCPNLGFRIQLEEYARVLQDGRDKGRALPARSRLGGKVIRKLTGAAQKEPNLSTISPSMAPP